MKNYQLYFLLCIFFLLGLGSEKVVIAQGAKRLKIRSEKTIKKDPKTVKGGGTSNLATGLAGITLVTQYQLLQAFKEAAGNKEPIQSNFINETSNNIQIEISLDGEQWHKRNLQPHEMLDVTSDDTGIIALRDKEGNIHMNDQSGTYLVGEENGESDYISNESEKDAQ